MSHASQAAWLQAELESAAERFPYRLALYHIPLYPCHRDYSGSNSRLGRESWLPLFDRYRLTLAFEHHDHALKRTFPLRGGAVTAGGTVYLGDGCFGRSPRSISGENVLPDGTPYLAHAEQERHFWLADLTREGLFFQAIGSAGQKLDESFATR